MKSTKYNFNALTPIDDADIGVSESALDFVFSLHIKRNTEARNFCISPWFISVLQTETQIRQMMK